jgi:hypothetical protein
MIEPKVLYQIQGDHLIELLRQAGLEGAKAAQQYLKQSSERWINEIETMKILECGKSKLYRLRIEEEIKYTPGYKKKYLESSLYDYLKREANKI